MSTSNLAMALRAAYLSMHRQTNFYLQKFGVTADQFVCLSIIFENDGLTQQEISKIATSDANTVRAMLILLEKQKLIVRLDHPNDGRAFKVSMTKKGTDLFELMTTELKPLQDKMLSIYNSQDLQKLYSDLYKMSNELV